jgi:uroporphyrinogen decarboxylase
VIFHSDGNLNAVVDDLVAAGIDGLNPIETASDMNLAKLHKRHPKLVLIGGISVTDLLALGTPDMVRDAVVKAIEDTEGRLMVGSDSEIANSVPIANFHALRDTVLNYKI